MKALMTEVLQIAVAEGVGLGGQDVARWDAVLASMPAAGWTSMAQDTNAGRETEVETFAGRSAPCEIRRGNLVREMIDFCRKYGAEEIHVTRSPSPAYRLWTEQLRHTLVVVEYAPETLVKWSGRPPRRFLELWEQAYPQLLPEEKPGAGEDEES